MMTIEEQKMKVANAALKYTGDHRIIGVGTGSTVNYFIDALATINHHLEGAVASSIATAERLKCIGIPLIELNDVNELSLYIDGADAYNPHCQLVKGGGGAMTREKILAYASRQFICIVDKSKETRVFGEFPIPVEVIPMARSFVAREIVKLGGSPAYRQNFVTDNGNIILDIHDWVVAEPIKLERALNNIPGVVGNGFFAEKPANLILISEQEEIHILKARF